MTVQVPNGVVDVLVEDEAEAVKVAKHTCPTSRAASRTGAAPTSASCGTSCRKTACAATTCAQLIDTLADEGSVLEIRRGFGPA